MIIVTPEYRFLKTEASGLADVTYTNAKEWVTAMNASSQ
jgi:hypothetical protein